MAIPPWPLTPPMSSLPRPAHTFCAAIVRPPTPPNSDRDSRESSPTCTQMRQQRPTIAVDWLGPQQSPHLVAEKYCEVLCYIWFSSPPTSASSSAPYLLDRTKVPTTLQLLATPAFVTFMQKLLETTQVSQSVIVLSLHYVYKLKERNKLTAGQPGSEFRIGVAALMMANKFLDDNTYLNRTWADVSGIALAEINKMEREFLMGISFELFADMKVYESWVRMLGGLVTAKERDAARHRPRRRRAPVSPTKRTVNHYRARSTSPTSPCYGYSPPHPSQQHQAHVGSKRTAQDAAFSPLVNDGRPTKKRPALQIPVFGAQAAVTPRSAPPRSRPHSTHSPMDLGFARMSLDTSPMDISPIKGTNYGYPPPPMHPPSLVPAHTRIHPVVPHTWTVHPTQSYSALQSSFEPSRRATPGQPLAYYKLESSPPEDEDSSGSSSSESGSPSAPLTRGPDPRRVKRTESRLSQRPIQYFHPQQPQPQQSSYCPPHRANGGSMSAIHSVQSATSSPHFRAAPFGSKGNLRLPTFQEVDYRQGGPRSNAADYASLPPLGTGYGGQSTYTAASAYPTPPQPTERFTTSYQLPPLVNPQRQSQHHHQTPFGPPGIQTLGHSYSTFHNSIPPTTHWRTPTWHV